MIWNEARECISRDELANLQGKRLVKLVKRMYCGVDYYRKKMQEIGLEPEDIKGIEDLKKLPFTTKEDLRGLYPFGMLAVPQSEIVRYHTSSGTTGDETMVGYTRNDIDSWSECMARCIAMAGITRDDVVQIAYNYGLFTGGLGAHYGAEKVGAAVVPSSIGNSEKLLKMMKDMQVTAVMCTPSYLMHIVKDIEYHGIKDKLKLRTAICGGNPWQDNFRNQLENTYNIKVYDVYGISELSGPGVAGECEYCNGMHVQEDYFVPEIVDSDTLIDKLDGEKGELVFTTLHKEGVPLIRYRTKDITSITREKCKCGRTLARISKLDKREDAVIMVRGRNVYPANIKEALSPIRESVVQIIIVVNQTRFLDEISIEIGLTSEMMEKEADVERLKQKVVEIIGKMMGVIPQSCIVKCLNDDVRGTNWVILKDMRKMIL